VIRRFKGTLQTNCKQKISETLSVLTFGLVQAENLEGIVQKRKDSRYERETVGSLGGR
jgi:hypothetical protein